MRLCALLALLASQLHLAAADVKITSPAAGSTIAAGGLVTVTWKESGEKPLLAELGEYTIQLYSGSNAAPVRPFLYLRCWRNAHTNVVIKATIDGSGNIR
jgi:hypothetical protein